MCTNGGVVGFAKNNPKYMCCCGGIHSMNGSMAIVITQLVLMLVSVVLIVLGVESVYFVIYNFLTIIFCLVTLYGLMKYKSMMVFIGVIYHGLITVLSTIGLVIYIIIVGASGGIPKDEDGKLIAKTVITGLLLVAGVAFYAWWTLVLHRAKTYISDKVVHDLLAEPHDGHVQVAGGGDDRPGDQGPSAHGGPPAYDDVITEKPKDH